VSLGHRSGGPAPSEAPHGAHEPAELAHAVHRLGSGNGSSPGEGHVPGPARQTAGVLPLRWRAGQLSQPATVLQPRPATPLHVGESPQPAAKLHVARLHRTAPPLSGRTAAPRRAPEHATGHVGSIGRIAAARLPEAPGAGTLHAGICAGAVGSPAVLPRWWHGSLRYRTHKDHHNSEIVPAVRGAGSRHSRHTGAARRELRAFTAQ
jgi:hypothetical protein